MCNLSEHNLNTDNRPFLAEVRPAAAGTRKYLTSMRDVRERVDGIFRQQLPMMFASIDSARDTGGNLDFRQKNRVMREVGEAVQRIFVGADGRNPFADDGVTALSPFAALLNEFYVRVTMEAIYTQRDWMQRNLPDDLFRWLASQTFAQRLGEAENPFLRRDGESDEEFEARLQDLRVFNRDPLVELERNREWVPMHRWNTPNGYSLSRRIWNAGLTTRQQIDALIEDAFDEGIGALELSRRLQRFLLPGEQFRITDKPYGTNAAYSAMRLARTEISQAANRAAYVSAYLNPYVDKVDVARSRTGDPQCPICPQHATIGIGGERLRPPYSIHAAMTPVYHPNCKCHVRPVVTDSAATVTMRLRAVMQDARRNSLPPAVTPAAADEFTQMLLHRSLHSLVGQFRGQYLLPGF